jgi:hypothetical protein
MTQLLLKHQLSKFVNLDSRAIERIGFLPTAKDGQGRSLYKPNFCKGQLEAYRAGKKSRGKQTYQQM